MSPRESHARPPRWKTERALVDRLSDPLLEHDAMMVAIATAFGCADCAEQLRDWLDNAARPLFTAPGDLRGRAAALTDLMTNHLCLETCLDRHEAVLLDRVIAVRLGHPLLLASIGHELARRAGWSSLTARTPDREWTLLTTKTYFVPIAYGAPLGPLDPASLTVCCPHEITHAILATISRHAPPELATSATRVRHALARALSPER